MWRRYVSHALRHKAGQQFIDLIPISLLILKQTDIGRGIDRLEQEFKDYNHYS